MSAPRRVRLAQNIRDLLAELIDRELKDPRVRGAGFVGVNHVELNKDASVARIYVSFFGGEADAVAAAMKGLEASAGFLHNSIGRRLALKRAPELRFIHDDSPEMQVRLSEIVRDDARRPGEVDDPEDPGD
jgi:ribosome-binding factor A